MSTQPHKNIQTHIGGDMTGFQQQAQAYERRLENSDTPTQTLVVEIGDTCQFG